MKSLLAVITLVFGLGLVQAPAFASSPKAKPESPNIAAGRKAINAKDFKSAVGNLTKAVQENPGRRRRSHHARLQLSQTRHLRQIDGALPDGPEDRFQSSERA